MFRKLVNIGINSLKRNNFGVMAGKVLLRIRERSSNARRLLVTKWCQQHAGDFAEYARSLDSELWEETEAACAQISSAASETLARIGLDLGGGGHFPLLYFLARRLHPRNVLETGVAAGWSSQALLLALEKNTEGGQLYSSDFPYFRYENPENLVGVLVEPRLRQGWHLFIDGDRHNLPKILRNIGPIDLFHYDSDKSVSGRNYALDAVRPHLSDRAVLLFDDIQDNDHFERWVTAEALSFRVFEFGGKFVGMVEHGRARAS